MDTFKACAVVVALTAGYLIAKDAWNVMHATIESVEASADNSANCLTFRSRRPLDAADVRYILGTRRPDLLDTSSTITDAGVCGKDRWTIPKRA